MNKKMKKYLIFASSIVLVLGVVGFLMFGLWDFNDTTNDRGLRLDNTDDSNRGDYPFIGDDVTFTDIGEAVGYLLWEARGVDIIIVGIILLVASEAASTVVKGIQDQCTEFRAEMCETDKFIILEQKEEAG